MRWEQRIVSSIDERTNSAGMKTLQSIVSNTDEIDELYYLQSILSSRLINFWCINYLADDMNQSYLSKIPVKSINNKKIKTELIKTLELLIKLKGEVNQMKLADKINLINQRIEHSEDKINQLVYQLYELTPEEIAIVEESIKA